MKERVNDDGTAAVAVQQHAPYNSAVHQHQQQQCRTVFKPIYFPVMAVIGSFLLSSLATVVEEAAAVSTANDDEESAAAAAAGNVNRFKAKMIKDDDENGKRGMQPRQKRKRRKRRKGGIHSALSFCESRERAGTENEKLT